MSERRKEQRRKWYIKNKERISKQRAEYYQKNKEKRNEYEKQYRLDKPHLKKEKDKRSYERRKEDILKKKKEYYQKNKEKILIQRSEYQQKNKERIAKYKNEYTKNRFKSDISFRIKSYISRNFRNALKIFSKNKKTKALKEYGIDTQLIIEKLGQPPQDGAVYHIDHIFPISAFDLNNHEHIKLCWHPNNLRWLEASKNMSKNNKYDKKLFEEYLNGDASYKVKS